MKLLKLFGLLAASILLTAPVLADMSLKHVPSLREMGYPTDDFNQGVHSQPIHNREKFFYDMSKGYGSSRDEQGCSWAVRPFIYVFHDGVVYLSSDLTNYNVFSHQVVRSMGCRIPATSYVNAATLDRHVTAGRLRDFGINPNARAQRIHDSMSFFNAMEKAYLSSQQEQNCLWAMLPNIYVFTDAVVYVDGQRTFFNSYPISHVRQYGCYVPYVTFDDGMDTPDDGLAVLHGRLNINGTPYRIQGTDRASLHNSCLEDDQGVDAMITNIKQITVIFNNLPEVTLFNSQGTWNGAEEVCQQIIGYAESRWAEVFGDDMEEPTVMCPGNKRPGEIWNQPITGGVLQYVCTVDGTNIKIGMSCEVGYKPQGDQCVLQAPAMTYEQCVDVFRRNTTAVNSGHNRPGVQCTCGYSSGSTVQLAWTCRGPGVNETLHLTIR